MLIQFSVANYLSIKNKCILSLNPSTDKEHPENITSTGKDTALNGVVIYGANASGKSNLFKAITTSILMIRGSHNIQLGERLPVVPFKFDPNYADMPTSFEYVFIPSDGYKYIYGFSANSEKIIEEYLYCYKTSKPSKIFERTNTHDYSFTRSLVNELQPLVERNTDNKLFLATATMWNANSTKAAFEWFNGWIDTFTNGENNKVVSLEMYRQDKDRQLLSFSENLMKQADININAISFEARAMTEEETQRQPISVLINGSRPIANSYIARIITSHEIKDENGVNTYSLNLEDESEGTRQIFYCAPLLSRAFENGSVLVIDEIDKSLHPFIVKHLIDLFRNPTVNKHGAQLIATTHDTSLLSLNTFRRDQIYFTEKNASTGITDLYSLDEFPVRKSENIEKGYLLGRYGAIPYLHPEDISIGEKI